MGRAVVNWALDTFVSSASPSTPLSDNQYTWVTYGSRAGFIHMNTPAPLGATILSAKLRLRSTTTQSSAFIHLERCRGGRPAYSHLTWNNQVAGVDGSAVVVSHTAGQTQWEFDVTEHMQIISDGANWFGWRLRADNPSGNVRFYSQESGRGPQLEVEWSDSPDAPTSLQPSGGRAVANTHPRFRFDYVDVAGDTTLTAVRVQINDSDSFASPMFDSGRVLSSRAQFNTAGSGYTGAVSGETHHWRVCVQDGAGLWSEWSESRSFTYEGKGELTVTSPSEAGLVISDDTPVVAWSLSGRMQAAYQVIVARTIWPGNWLWTSGKVTSDVTSVTVPSRVIRHDDRNYRITVRVWDTIDRVNTPGDPRSYQVERDVHFDEDAGVAPVSSLFADAIDATPEVVLTAERATTPDRWMILRGNEIIHSCEGMDLHVEGTTYRYVDRTAPGMAEARYRFQPVENNARAWGNIVASCWPDPRYLWVTSLDGELQVPLLNAELEWEPESQTELLTPLGARRPILVRQSLGARKGTVSGEVWTDTPGVLGVTAADHLETLRRLNAAGEQVRLVVGDENVPAMIYDLNRATRIREEQGVVEFSVFQDGEFPDEED